MPRRKIPDQIWLKWSDIVYDQMGIVSSALRDFQLLDEAGFFDRYRGDLRALWLRARLVGDVDKFRKNFADIYQRFLIELPPTSSQLQELLGEDWAAGNPSSGKGGFKTERGARIFGFPSREEPRGIGDGKYRFGYLPYVMRNLIVGETEATFFGTLKPRTFSTSPRRHQLYEEYRPAFSSRRKPLGSPSAG